MRTYAISEKLNDISELNDGSKGEDLSSLNMKTLNRLFELRNRFVHFKEMIEFQPFASASEVELLLAWDEMLEFLTVSKNVILFLSKHSSLDASFLVGDFETVTVDA